MIYFSLFLSFFKIGLFTIGGGYAMIPMIMDEVVGHGWLTSESVLDFIAISESTPGPLAINISTFVGAHIGNMTSGFAGSLLGATVCTLGVALPSIIIISIIALVFSNLTKKRVVKNAFNGLNPAVVGLIGAACLTIAMQVFFGVANVGADMFKNIDWAAIVFFVILLIVSSIRIKGKKVHPILFICLGALVGLMLKFLNL